MNAFSFDSNKPVRFPANLPTIYQNKSKGNIITNRSTYFRLIFFHYSILFTYQQQHPFRLYAENSVRRSIISFET